MKQSCINHPPKDRMIVVREWQLVACDGNEAAAALLSFFEYWHNIKLEQREKAVQANNTAALHGDPRSQDEGLWQFHSEKDLEAGVLVFKRDAVRKGRAVLRSKGFISESRNPNPRYKFDRTTFFLFHIERVNDWLNSYRSTSPENPSSKPENRSPSPKNPLPSPEIPSPLPENPATIPEITPETTSEKKSVAARVPRSASTPKAPKSFADENWLDYFRSKKVWEGIDIERVKEKMEVWCEVHGKKPSPRRLVSWLNSEDGEAVKKADEPLSPQELVIVEACALELPLTATQRKEVRDCAAFMREHQGTTGRLKREATEYWHRWQRPGEPRRDPPRPSQLCEKWSAFVEWEKKHPAKLEGASPKERCPKCYGLGRVKSVPGEIDSPKVPCPVCSPQPAQSPPKGDLAA